ncbi:hypothetical protein APHWI1_1103 [Anaplasma phagocytophilum str. ApWI1]|uniref:Uncharacterized protein n=2 Tax=Anaplasma phagocytophilum TaxID=948 RepID=A0A0F3NK83_ANAPH|nr:hypothetical protein APHWEB_0410 [Anaplasma phagocytophilum str. Webster]KJV68473.1 hypothetical protein EPHNCH_0315 [Anaplasma phagocytophilum str. NCH-1]KJV82970.1 hypothetical protein APHHGE2_0329 [Anaplasma phagocytophilum str. HGE2]KJV85351.1 hypothetical protein APHWI1_1103 [Anaplasma phagocytophilum str. ApWI1]KJV99743.1 hypothetical protein OTSANNIE_0281 [Anaplasma phagocytophilum str. Annie]
MLSVYSGIPLSTNYFSEQGIESCPKKADIAEQYSVTPMS